MEEKRQREIHATRMKESSEIQHIQDIACTMCTALSQPSSMRVPSGKSKTLGVKAGETRVSPTSKPMEPAMDLATCISMHPSGSRPTWSEPDTAHTKHTHHNHFTRAFEAYNFLNILPNTTQIHILLLPMNNCLFLPQKPN